MKTLILFCMMLPLGLSAQQYILIDRKLKEPFRLQDTITLKEVSMGAFPIYAADLPMILARLQEFSKEVATGKKTPGTTNTYSTQHCRIVLRTGKEGYACQLQTNNSFLSLPMAVASGGRKETLKDLNRFMDYLRHNKVVMDEINRGQGLGGSDVQPLANK